MSNSALANETLLREAVESSLTVSSVLRKLNLRQHGGNYKTFYKYCEKYSIDYSHFTGSDNAAARLKTTIPYDKILVKNSTYNSTSALKKRLLRDGFLPNRCQMVDCPNPEAKWRGKKLTLQLDHINGIRSDNRLENLRILCPNCHTQTDTHSGKQKGKKCHCGVHISRRAEQCLPCSNSAKNKDNTKYRWPPNGELIDMVKSNGWEGSARMIGCSSGNTVKKRLSSQGINPKSIRSRG